MCENNPETPARLAYLLSAEMRDHQHILALAKDVAQAYRRHQRMNDKGGFLQAVWKLADYLEPQK